MTKVVIPQNTSVVDVAFNLSGSLAGLPSLLTQLPVGERIGFDTLPDIGTDVADIGQTWSPDLQGLQLDLNVSTFNTNAVLKAPFTTDLNGIQTAIDYGNAILPDLGVVIYLLTTEDGKFIITEDSTEDKNVHFNMS